MGFRRVPKRVIIQGNDILARSHIGEADSLLNLCETQAGFQSLQQFQMVRNLQDGSQIIARMYAGLSDVTITSPSIPKELEAPDAQGFPLEVIVFVGNAEVGFWYLRCRADGTHDGRVRHVMDLDELLTDRPYSDQDDCFTYMNLEGVGYWEFTDFPAVLWCASLPPDPALPPGEPCSFTQRIDFDHELTGEHIENFRTYQGKRRDMFESPTYVSKRDGNTYSHWWQSYFDQRTINAYGYFDPVMLPAAALRSVYGDSVGSEYVLKTRYFDYVIYGYRGAIGEPWPPSLYEVAYSPTFGFIPDSPIGLPRLILGEPNIGWQQNYDWWYWPLEGEFDFHPVWAEIEPGNEEYGYLDGSHKPSWWVSKVGPYNWRRSTNDVARVPARQEFNHRNYPDSQGSDAIFTICREAKQHRGIVAQLYCAAFTSLVMDQTEQDVYDPEYEVLGEELTVLVSASIGATRNAWEQERSETFEDSVAFLLENVRAEQIAAGLLDGPLEYYPFLGQVGLYFSNVSAPQSEKMSAMLTTLDLTNELRASLGLGLLQWDFDLAKACVRHCRDMADNEFMSHTGSDDSTIWSRTYATGFFAGGELTGGMAGENLATDPRSGYFPGDVMQGWIDSPSHYANLVYPDFTRIAFDIRIAESGETYWCQVFGHNQHRR